MAKCKSRETGKIYDFFIFGTDEVPDWFDNSMLYLCRDGVHVVRTDYGVEYFDLFGFNSVFDVMDVSVRSCKNLASGEICEYFVYGVDNEPEWYGNKGGWFEYENGNILVCSKKEDSIFKFRDIDQFKISYDIISSSVVRYCSPIGGIEVYEYFVGGVDNVPSWFDEVKDVFKLYGNQGIYVHLVGSASKSTKRFGDYESFLKEYEEIKVVANDIPEIVDSSIAHIAEKKRCFHKQSGVECDYFIYDRDPVPEWCDIVGGIGDYVVCDPEGVILCYHYELFKTNFIEIEFELVEDWNTCVRYMDGRVFSYNVDGSSFVDQIIVRLGKDYDVRMTRQHFYMCFSVKGSYGEPIKKDFAARSQKYEPGVGEHDIFKDEEVKVHLCSMDEGNKISVSTDGELYIDPKASFKFSVGKVEYRKNSTGKLIDFFIYDIRSKWYPEWFDKRKDKFPIPESGDFVVNNNGPGLFDKGSFYDMFQVVEPSLLVSFDEEVSCVGDKCGVGENRGAAARFCRCRNDHSVVHEYFIYGVDAPPSWFNDKVYSKGTFVVRRGDSGIIFDMTPLKFKENLELCGPDGEVEVLSPANEKKKNLVDKTKDAQKEFNDLMEKSKDYTGICRHKKNGKLYAYKEQWGVFMVYEEDGKNTYLIPHVFYGSFEICQDVYGVYSPPATDNWQKGLDEYAIKKAMDESGGSIDVVDAAKEFKINDAQVNNAKVGICLLKNGDHHLLEYVVISKDFHNYPFWINVLSGKFFDGDHVVYDPERRTIDNVGNWGFNEKYIIVNDYMSNKISEMAKNPNNWIEEEDINGYIELTFNTKMCKNELGEELIYFKKGDEIPEWFKLSGSDLKFYQEYIVYYGWLDFRSFTEMKFNFGFKDLPGCERTLRIPLFEEENLNLPKDIKDAKKWFNNLHPEVFRHIVLRQMNIDGDGMVNMLKLYKDETNG